MGRIKTVYVCNHAHTDIGFTDYQDNCFRQHASFIDQALDLIEATDSYPDAARYRWTCETTGTLMRYFRWAGTGQVERIRHWHARGRIDIAAMQYNLTPLLVLRDIASTGARTDSFFSVDPAAPVLVTAKPGEDGAWVALRVQNLARSRTNAFVNFVDAPREARLSDPIEHAGESLQVDGRRLAVDLAPLAVSTVLVKFAA